MKVTRFSHEGGEAAIAKSVARGVEEALELTTVRIGPKCTRDIRQRLGEQLRTRGWSDAVRISARRGITITAAHGSVGLCVQTGNMARFYADLLKLQAQYLDGKLSAAVYVLPMASAAVSMGSNIVNFERFTGELELFRKVITVPLLVLGFEATH